LGKRQTGLMQLKVANLVRDAALLPTVQELAEILLDKYPAAVAGLQNRWIGVADQYGSV